MNTDLNEYRKAADKMATAHKVERDVLQSQIDKLSSWTGGGIEVSVDAWRLVHAERDELRAKLAALEEQKPVAWRFVDDEDRGHVSYSTTPPTKPQVEYLAKWNRPTWQPLCLAAGAAQAVCHHRPACEECAAPQGEQQ